MVLGEAEGAAMARRLDLDALFLLRGGEGLRPVAVGRLFAVPVGTDEVPGVEDRARRWASGAANLAPNGRDSAAEVLTRP